MSKLICPVCHSEVVLPEHSSVTCGVTLAKDTDNNTYKLNMETTKYGTENNTTKEINNMGKVTERLNALKAAGVDTSNFFSVLSPNGDEVAMKWVNGIPIPCDESELEIDPIEQHIFANGYVKNTKLHRRWIMSQMFHALNYPAGYTEWLKNHGYDYQWKMVIEECRVMSKIEGKDEEAFKERSMFFNQDVIKEMLNHYLFKLDKYIFNLKEHKCKRKIPYYRIPRFGDVFVTDIDKRVFSPFIKLYNQLKYTEMSYRDLYNLLLKFKKIYIELPYDTPMSKDFVDAYKAEGAYYTLKNMILFHNVEVPEYRGINIYSGHKAMEYVRNSTITAMNYGEGYTILALLKATIEHNNFDFDKRMEELGVY